MTDNRLFIPHAVDTDADPPMPVVATLTLIAAVVALAAFFVLNLVHEQHAWHGDQAATAEFMDCSNAAFKTAITTGAEYNSDACKPVMPWYAAHPGWYALAIGLAVFVVGRLALFMVRVERSRGY